MAFISCEKENDKNDNGGDNNTVISISDAQKAVAEYIMVSEEFKKANTSADESQIDAQEKLETRKAGINSDTVVITIDPFDLFTFPKTITADFGTNGILGPDLVVRKGKIVSTINKWRFDEGSVRQSVFENYYHNTCQIQGNITSTNLGENTDGFLVVEVVIENGKYICDEDKTVTFTRNSTLTHIAGFDTKFFIWDDEYSIEAVEECVSSDGTKLKITTVEPLIYSTLTKAKGGVLSVEIENFLLPIIIDYDKQETTIGGMVFPFE